MILGAFVKIKMFFEIVVEPTHSPYIQLHSIYVYITIDAVDCCLPRHSIPRGLSEQTPFQFPHLKRPINVCFYIKLV